MSSIMQHNRWCTVARWIVYIWNNIKLKSILNSIWMSREVFAWLFNGVRIRVDLVMVTHYHAMVQFEKAHIHRDTVADAAIVVRMTIDREASTSMRGEVRKTEREKWTGCQAESTILSTRLDAVGWAEVCLRLCRRKEWVNIWRDEKRWSMHQ